MVWDFSEYLRHEKYGEMLLQLEKLLHSLQKLIQLDYLKLIVLSSNLIIHLELQQWLHWALLRVSVLLRRQYFIVCYVGEGHRIDLWRFLPYRSKRSDLVELRKNKRCFLPWGVDVGISCRNHYKISGMVSSL